MSAQQMPEHIEDIYALSPTQQGMLFHTIYAPTSGVYCEQFRRFVPHLKLDRSACERAWQQVVDRHAILRTSFHWEDVEKPLQVVHRNIHQPVLFYDWSDLDEAEQTQRLETYVREDRRQGFDLAQAPLMRIIFIHVGHDSYQFIWSYHHILLDGWSAYIVLEEFFQLYAALQEGRTPKLPEPHPYHSYISWLRRQNMQVVEQFWRTHLRGFTAPTLLPAQQGRLNQEPGQEQDYTKYSVHLGKETTRTLHEFARTQHVTLSTVIQGCWAILLSRYSGEKDIVFGTVVSGRPVALEGAEAMVGLFTNTLPMRITVSPESEPLAWFQAFQQRQAALREFEYSPLVQIQQWSDLPTGTPLFESILAVETYPVRMYGEMFGRMSEMNVFQRTNYPLNVSVEPGQDIAIWITFDRRRFTERFIEDLLAHYRTLLSSVLANTASRLADLTLLSAPERQRILYEWNDTATAYPKELSLPELFAQQVALTPSATALADGKRQMSYEELDKRTNQLTHYLQRLGVVPGSNVALCLNRSLEMIVGMLAIIKAGGAYVPLDLAYPADRLQWVLADCQATVLISQQDILEQTGLHAFEGLQIICLDQVHDQLAQENACPPTLATPSQRDRLAYIIYTSGSTGHPKGVAVPHTAVVRLLCNTNYISLTAEDAVAQAANSAFDAATFEIWGALLSGGRLVILPKEIVLSPHELANQLHEHGITTLFVTTALFNQIARTQPDAFNSVKHLLFGGEAVDPEAVRTVLRAGGPTRLLHVYGPTESTTFATWHLVTQVDDQAMTIPIGKPLANTTTYLLDESLQPVPIGAPGELFIGGDGLALGYWQRTELTSAHFIEHAFPDGDTIRLYRTGDIARYLPDGSLEFIGRKDDQVKFHGFRIELAEIETALLRLPAIHEALVLLREDVPSDKRLVAYLVKAENEELDIKQLRTALQQVLPEYMLPSSFIELSAFPLTPNGKIDRRALPAPEQHSEGDEQQYIAPRNAIEQALAEIWSEVLGIAQVSVEANFFDLGGHSLLATRLISRVRSVFLIDVPLHHLFQFPTISAFAVPVAQKLAELAGEELLTEVMDTDDLSSQTSTTNNVSPQALEHDAVAGMKRSAE